VLFVASVMRAANKQDSSTGITHARHDTALQGDISMNITALLPLQMASTLPVLPCVLTAACPAGYHQEHSTPLLHQAVRHIPGRVCVCSISLLAAESCRQAWMLSSAGHHMRQVCHPCNQHVMHAGTQQVSGQRVVFFASSNLPMLSPAGMLCIRAALDTRCQLLLVLLLLAGQVPPVLPV
jgi:hypothetical protein